MHRMPATVDALAKGRFAGRPPIATGDKRKLPAVSPDQSRSKLSRPLPAEEMDVVSSRPPSPGPVSAASIPLPPSPAAPAVVDDGFVLVEHKKGKLRTLRPRPHPADVALRDPPSAKLAAVTTILFYPSSDVSIHSLPRMRLADALGHVCRSISMVRFIRKGGIAVDFPCDVPVAPILAIEKLLDAPVRACLPKPKEGCVGTVVGEFSASKEFEELYGMHEDNPPLLKVHQIGKTRTWVLHFSSPSLPPRVRIFYNIHRVKPFFHPPLQCFKCQRFGHPAELCRGAVVCSKCAQKGHSFSDCPSTVERCVNCAGDHSARYKQCSHRVFAVRVQKHLASNPVSRLEARRAVASSLPPPPPSSGVSKPTSYASAVSSTPARAPSPVGFPSLPPPPPTASLGTQTGLPSPPPPPPAVSLGTQTDPVTLNLRELPGFSVASEEDVLANACVVGDELFPSWHEVMHEFLVDFHHAADQLGFSDPQRVALYELCMVYREK